MNSLPGDTETEIFRAGQCPMQIQSLSLLWSFGLIAGRLSRPADAACLLHSIQSQGSHRAGPLTA